MAPFSMRPGTAGGHPLSAGFATGLDKHAGFARRAGAGLEILAQDVVKSSAIEGTHGDTADDEYSSRHNLYRLPAQREPA